MSAAVFTLSGSFSTTLEALVQRRNAEGAPYLITLFLGTPGVPSLGAVRFPQAHAVMDDFGQLVLVRGWK